VLKFVRISTGDYMYDYIKGKIENIDSNSITIENNNIGYKILVALPNKYQLNEEVKIYIYQKISENDITLFGFDEKIDRSLFEKLINIKRLGPKVVIKFYEKTTSLNIIEAIENNDINYLKTLPKVGDIQAKEIINKLKGKIKLEKINTNLNDLYLTLKSLGYKKNEIDRVIFKVDTNKSIDNQIKEALKYLS
jgi:Holliday junction DNA helicase RuvA